MSIEITNQFNKNYKIIEGSVYSCQYHVIFTTKYRRKVLSESVQERLKEIILEKQSDYTYEILDIEIMEDHVHLLIDCSPYTGIYKTVGRIKGITSNVLRKEFTELRKRLPTLWTRNKFISSVGSVSLGDIKKYIENQKNK